MKRYFLITITFLPLLMGLPGCTRIVVNSMMGPTIDNLQRQTDVDLVCEGTSSFLLMLDSMIAADPDNTDLLLSATQAYTAYAITLDVCGRTGRAATVSIKAKDYGLNLLADNDNLATISTMEADAIHKALKKVNKNEVGQLFWSGNGWATWIRFQEGAPAALADLIRVEKIMLRVLELDETFYYGGAHLFLGAYYGAKPAMLGGQHKKSREHFEKALAISNREYLPTQIAYAQIYAKMTYDRELFVQLIQEVLDFPLDKRPDIALANQAAKRMAVQMMEQVGLFF